MPDPKPAPAPLAAPAPGARRKLARWARRVGLGFVALAALSVMTVVLAIRHYEQDLPDAAELKTFRPPQVTRILARDGTLLGELFTERRTVIPFEQIPAELKLAALAAEDASFYEHTGLSYVGMLRAVYVNLRGGSLQGGSTITQQVVKNTLLSPERTYERKIREAILARRIEQELTKDEILGLYLNYIYFGHGRYGVEEAARYYFGKSAKDLHLGEAAMIAGLIKGPRAYSPRVDLARATTRRDAVLEQMVDKGFAPRERIEAAKREPIALGPAPETLSELSPEAVDEARRVLRAVVGADAERGGYTVTTTIDPTLQAAARAAVRKNLDEWAKRHKALGPLALAKKGEPAPFEGTPAAGAQKAFLGVVTGADDAAGRLLVRVGTRDGAVNARDLARYNPKALPPSAFAPVGKTLRVSFVDGAPAEPGGGGDGSGGAPDAPNDARPALPAHLEPELGPEGALVAVDVRTGEIRALVGGYDARRGSLDRTRAAHRQPGSTMKAVVYSYALHTRSFTLASLLETSPRALEGYRPGNFDESEGQAPHRLREALAHSVNVAAVWTLQQVGAKNVAEWGHALGIESKLGADLSLALGAYEVTPREMVTVYATFASGGVYQPPILITKLTGPDGRELALPPRAPSRRVLDEDEAYLVTSALGSVVDHGTATRAKTLRRPVAGKTGTSNDAKDAWFVGYTPELACAVWTGFDDGEPLGRGEAGATAALPAFIELMRAANEGRPVVDFAVPAGLSRVKIDPESGLLARPDQEDAIDELFLPGTEPKDVATPDAGVDDGFYDPPDADTLDAGPAPLPVEPPPF